jgi:WD40 repeat protein
MLALAFDWSCGAAGGPGSGDSGPGVKLQRVQTFDGFYKGTFSPDGNHLALVGRSRTDVIETAAGRKMFSIAPAGALFLGARFSPDNRLLATACQFNAAGRQAEMRVTLWGASSGLEKLSLPGGDSDWRRPLQDLSFTPDGRLLASSIGGIARLWDVESGKESRRFIPGDGPPEQKAERVLLSPDGKLFAAYFDSPADGTYHRVYIWNLETGQRKDFETEVYLDWRFSADSKLLALTAITERGKPAERSVAEIWEAGSARRIKALEVPHDWRGAYTLAFSPDQKLLAVGGYKKFGLFSIETGQLLASETHHGGSFWQDSEMPNQLGCVEFSPDGMLLLTGGNDNTVRLWHIDRQ